MKTLTDEQIRSIRRGGHDPVKVHAAYACAVRGDGRPTVVLAKTIKGFAMGTSAEGRNAAHQKKTLTGEERVACARRLGVPLDEEAIKRADFYLPSADSALRCATCADDASNWAAFSRYAIAHARRCRCLRMTTFQELLAGSTREISTTMALVRLLTRLMRDPQIGRLVVPIVPDEARTFGMDGLFRHFGIYASSGQRYRPVDADALTVLQRTCEWPDPAGRHLRGRRNGVVHRGRDGLLAFRRADHSFLYLLFDVRFPAGGRSDLGGGRQSVPRLSRSAGLLAALR